MRVLLCLFFVVTFFACSPTASGTCSADTCTGCCDASGACQPGTTDTSCGGGGLNCDVCSGGQQCLAQRCAVPTPVDAGVMQPYDAGMPITAPVETWTWAGFPTSACGNGSPTGLGINTTNRSKDVFVFLMGGGACWNALTCQFAASNLTTGYDAPQFSTDTVLQAPMFDRTNALNPFKDMNFVFVPYCTGDVHVGDNVMMYPAFGAQVPARTVHHKGGKNLDTFLVRLKDTFPDAQRVFVAGSSAGAYGAQVNLPKFVAAWPQAQVHALADCGQMINPSGTLFSEWRASWNFTVPPTCTGCDTDFSKYPGWLATTFPQSRFALLAYTQDSTLRSFSGYDAVTFEQQTLALTTNAYDPHANAKYFVLAGSEHVMIDNLFTLQSPQGGSLSSWVSSFVQGSSTWQSVKP